MTADVTFPSSAAKPFAILAAAAFVVGFFGYLAATGVNLGELQIALSSVPTPAAAPASMPVVEHPAVVPGASDAWNIPKAI